MKHSVLLIAILFSIAGFLDWIIYSTKTNDKVYLSEKFNHETVVGNEYKIKGKFLQFEDNCNTMGFNNYQLISGLGDTLQSKTIFINTDDALKQYILFDGLESDFYQLTLTANKEKKYTSRMIEIPKSISFDYNDLISYFNSGRNAHVTMLPFTIQTKNKNSDCFRMNYTFYNNEQGELLIDYIVGSELLDEEHLSEVFKVNRDILKVIPEFEKILKENYGRVIESNNPMQIDFLGQYINTYSSHDYIFNFDLVLWNTIQKYKIKETEIVNQVSSATSN